MREKPCPYGWVQDKKKSVGRGGNWGKTRGDEKKNNKDC